MGQDPHRQIAGRVGDTLARLLELPHRRNVSAGTPRTGFRPAGALPDGDRNQLKAGATDPRIGPESAFTGIQDSVASCFKEFRDLLHLINLDAHFIQRFAKVNKKSIEMPIV